MSDRRHERRRHERLASGLGGRWCRLRRGAQSRRQLTIGQASDALVHDGPLTAVPDVMLPELSAEPFVHRPGPQQLDVGVRREATLDLAQKGREMLVAPAVGRALEIATAPMADRRVMADVAGGGRT